MSTFRTGHVGLNVTDLSTSLAFYREVLGFDVLREEDADGRRYAFLGRDGIPLLTLWQQSAGSFSAASPGLHHLAFEVDSLDEVAAAEQTLRDRDVTFHHDGIVRHAEGGSSGGIFFADPDGIHIEIFTSSEVPEDVPAVAGGPACGFF